MTRRDEIDAEIRFLSTPSARRATDALSPAFEAIWISIHALREEGDFSGSVLYWLCIRFLSTPSARRATMRQDAIKGSKAISIHALREEGDGRLSRPCVRGSQFLSTPSARRATLSSPSRYPAQ